MTSVVANKRRGYNCWQQFCLIRPAALDKTNCMAYFDPFNNSRLVSLSLLQYNIVLNFWSTFIPSSVLTKTEAVTRLLLLLSRRNRQCERAGYEQWNEFPCVCDWRVSWQKLPVNLLNLFTLYATKQVNCLLFCWHGSNQHLVWIPDACWQLLSGGCGDCCLLGDTVVEKCCFL